MAFSLSFNNIGHFFAKGFKYVSIGISDVIKFANKAQPLATEAEALAGALAGPMGAKISDLAFHTLGSVAAAITAPGVDAAAQAQAGGLNLQLDTQTVLDIKAAASQIESIFKALGAQKPAK